MSVGRLELYIIACAERANKVGEEVYESETGMRNRSMYVDLYDVKRAASMG